MKGPEKPVNQIHSTNFNSWNYSFYKKFVSPVSGKECKMHPNCSAYAEHAFGQHGFLAGFILMADRLTRCGSDLSYYKWIVINKKLLYDDPIPNAFLFDKSSDNDIFNKPPSVRRP
jgi:putative component of membrane protein insertase Oxa1/YidC/SpoIIIJ protein YidD